MTISTGDRLPEATFVRLGEAGPEEVKLSETLAGRKVVIFAVPGAFTPTCHSAHVPSFVRVMDQLKAKGVDEVICLAVNDPFVMKAWGEATGATAAGITMLSDPHGDFTKAVGLDFSALPVGLVSRSRRYALIADDGVVSVLNLEETPGECGISAGEALLEAL
ncbi:peroxiredoxin [Rhodovulum strictum]|uniref:Glutathione-dependent peroxiredoxin n=1 Tax=Rhodovulum strictum TaxID=58314 RepID=A0A844BLT5_9RHOB|nr:peroxiredoxin [Rhodovulum strictum]MRH20967.1 redoxin family protein [Rhodovulum strictum]